MKLSEYEEYMKEYILKDLTWLIRIYRKVVMENLDYIRNTAYAAAFLHGGYITIIFDCCTYKLRIISFSDEVTSRRLGESVHDYKKLQKTEVNYTIHIDQEDNQYLMTLDNQKEINNIKEQLLLELNDKLHEQIYLMKNRIIMFPEKHIEPKYLNNVIKNLSKDLIKLRIL